MLQSMFYSVFRACLLILYFIYCQRILLIYNYRKYCHLEYILSAIAESPSRCEKRCQYAEDVYQELLHIKDRIEMRSCCQVAFQEDNMVVVSGLESSVQKAIQVLDYNVQEIVRRKSKNKHSEELKDTGKNPELSCSGMSTKTRVLESEDSSYDSDYENGENASPRDGHDDVSRTVSDTLKAEYAEYVTTPEELQSLIAHPNYASRVEFALKLGYTELQVQTALQKLGPQAGQNELLAELIRLGATSRETEGTCSSDDVTNLGSDTIHQNSRNDSSNLRHIVIDGSNLAMSHGNKECFSCRGIQLAVDWFRMRGHNEITVFVPMWRKETSRPDAPIKDQEILLQLEKERLLVFTPSRQVKGRRIVPYDDRYILKLAAETDGIVVSNDNYRDLVNENPEYKKVVEERLLMYSFVNDRFMPPDDPLGRHGPSLENFIRKLPKAPDTLPPPCPYGKKCTYGNKCKYYHPERGNQPQKSVTERLAEHAKQQLQEVKARGLKSRDSSPGDKLKTKSLPLSGTSSSQPKMKKPLSRTKSLVPSTLVSAEPVDPENKQLEGSFSFSNPVSGGLTNLGPLGASWSDIPASACSWAATRPNLPQNICSSQAERFLDPNAGGHLTVAKRLSDPDSQRAPKQSFHSPQSVSNVGEETNLPCQLQQKLTLRPSFDPHFLSIFREGSGQRMRTPDSQGQNIQNQGHSRKTHQPLTRLGSEGRPSPTFLHPWNHVTSPTIAEHQSLTRIASAPDSCQQWPPSSAGMQRLNSTSDTSLNLYPDVQTAGLPSQGLVLAGYTGKSSPQRHWLLQGQGSNNALWTDSAVTQSHSIGHPVRSLIPAPRPDVLQDDSRHKVFYHLSSIFPAEQVRAVMELNPEETNAQRICAAILAMFPKG
ncbi:putative ribonuclease ZC3H12C isoform X2 [Tachypleus tridentatus]|uniref:putative ribonuclease ZC3H12C isoform X2 n=1 Tax=Tachypleus tridentatus TaxID=6853 RepID=UPI003FD0DB38